MRAAMAVAVRSRKLVAKPNAQLEQCSASRALPGGDPALALAAITAWSRLHGLASLEIEGTYTSMGIDAGLLSDAEVTAILTSLGHA